MEAKHTPGPWTVSPNGSSILSADGTEVVDLFGAMGGVDTEADARLIAAAPAMLAALLEVKRLRDLWRSQDDAVAIDSIAYMDGLDRIDVDTLLTRITS